MTVVLVDPLSRGVHGALGLGRGGASRRRDIQLRLRCNDHVVHSNDVVLMMVVGEHVMVVVVVLVLLM